MQSKMKTKSSAAKRFDFNTYMVYIIFLIVLGVFAIVLGPKFFSVGNLFAIVRQVSVIAIIAVTMTFVIAAGQIDLSVGRIIALSGLVSALIIRDTNSIPLAIVTSLAIGLVIGLVNGLLIVVFDLPAFLVTLGTQLIVYGIAMWSTNTVAVPIANKTFNFIFGGGAIGKVPLLLFWALAVAVIGHIVLKKTPYGKKVLAVGGNMTSAKYSGINVKKTIVSVFAFSGLAAALGGMLYSGRMETGRYTFGDAAELDAIAAVIIGGTSMAGGTGSIPGAIVGSLLLGVINNGLLFAGLSSAQQTVAKGIIIIASVALSSIGSLKVKAK